MFDYGSAISWCGRLCKHESKKTNAIYTSTLPPRTPTTTSTTIPTTPTTTIPTTSPTTTTPTTSPTTNTFSYESSLIIIASCVLTFIILLILGAILILKIRRKDKVASERESDQQQPRVDCDNLIKSTNSKKLDPEGECFYENIVGEPSAIELQATISPVYATLEFIPPCSAVEDYANTFRSVQFLNGDTFTTYAEINFK